MPLAAAIAAAANLHSQRRGPASNTSLLMPGSSTAAKLAESALPPCVVACAEATRACALVPGSSTRTHVQLTSSISDQRVAKRDTSACHSMARQHARGRSKLWQTAGAYMHVQAVTSADMMTSVHAATLECACAC